MTTHIIKIISVPLLLVVLAVAPASAQTISNTGPGSTNVIDTTNECIVDVDNNTEIDGNVDVDQDASSGDASNDGSTTGGGASTGDASNDSNVDIDIDVDNSTDGLSDVCEQDEQEEPTTPTDTEEEPKDGGVVLGDSTTSTPSTPAVLPSGAVNAGAGGVYEVNPVAMIGIVGSALLTMLGAVSFRLAKNQN